MNVCSFLKLFAYNYRCAHWVKVEVKEKLQG